MLPTQLVAILLSRSQVPAPKACLPSWEDVTGGRVRYRAGAPADALPIAGTLLAMKMNPLGVEPSQFIVCETASGSRIGFGQERRSRDSIPALACRPSAFITL
jgi:hypothetical protein